MIALWGGICKGDVARRQAQRIGGAHRDAPLRVLARAGHGHIRDRLRRTHLAPHADTVIVAYLVEAQARECSKAVRIAGREVVDRNQTCFIEEHELGIKHARELIDVPSFRKVRDEGRLGADDGVRRDLPDKPPRNCCVMIHIESF